MIVFDYIYFSIYSLIPNKAVLGKRDGACTLLSIFSSLVLFEVCFLTKLIEKNAEKKIFLLVGLLITFSLFIWTRKTFLKSSKFKKMHKKFRNIPKWVLRGSGILYLLLCLVLTFVMMTIVKDYY